MLTTTVYDEVTGEYYTRKATEFDGVGDPGEEKQINELGFIGSIYIKTNTEKVKEALEELRIACEKANIELGDSYTAELYDDDCNIIDSKNM